MLEIVKEREEKIKREYNREFVMIADPGFMYSFPCDADGNIHFACDEARENFECVRNNTEKFRDKGIVERKIRYTEPAVGRCKCGAKFEVVNHYLGALPCPKCGQWYNLSGQELKDPEYWEEDF